MHRIGVCSWSLGPSSPAELAQQVRACGLGAVQLALDPLRSAGWDEHATSTALASAGIQLLSGMMRTAEEDYTSLESIRRTGGIRPDGTWPANLASARENAHLAHRLGIRLVSLHAGFLPHDRRDPLRPTMLDRLRQIADIFANRGISVALETGQETAATLVEMLDDLAHPNVGVNFDPANMILYAMGDPVEALRLLASRVTQIHLKDARTSKTPGTWGEEVPVGDGAVDWPAFFRVVDHMLPDVDLVVEREAGTGPRADDVRRAHGLARRLTRLKD